MRKLLLQALVGFFFGVALRSFFDFDIEFLVLALFVAGFLGFIFWVRKESELILVQIAFFLAAFALGGLRYEIQDSREYVKAMEKNLGENVEVLGVLTEDPQKLEKFTRAILKTEEGVKILLSLPHYPEIKYGDKLKISGKLAEPQNFSDFDWKNYLAKDNIYFEMFLPEVSSREEGGFWLKKFLFSTKHSFIENLSKVLPEPHSSFLAGLTIGERSSLPEELEENFRNLGVVHIIALSGYNISIISDNSLKLINYIPVAKIIRTGIATLLVVLFALLTGASATVVRATIMGVLILWARETGKVYQALSALIFAAFLMTLFNPKILRFDASFQLSFLATAGLIFLAPRLETYFSRVPNVFKLRENLIATISAQIFVLPLLIYLGGTFSWKTLPANILMLSTIPYTMFLGFLSGLAGFISYYLSWIFAWPAYWLLAYELWIVKIFSGL